MCLFTPNAFRLPASLAPLALLFSFAVAVADTKPFTVAPIAGIAGQAIPVSVHVPEDLGPIGAGGPVFILFRDLPAELSFSAGFRARQGWLVSVKDLDVLMLISHQARAGVFAFEAVLYRGRNQEHLTHHVRVDLTEPPPGSADDAIGSIRSRPDLAPPTHPEPPATLSLPEVTELLRRADTLLHSADFESARLIYAALADNGIAQAAVLMAQTYDPEVLKKRFVVGMSPDIDKAMEWYRRAIELGKAVPGVGSIFSPRRDDRSHSPNRSAVFCVSTRKGNSHASPCFLLCRPLLSEGDRP